MQRGRMGRLTIKYCKECGEPFKETTRKKECTNCNRKRTEIIAKISAIKNKEERNEWESKILKTIAEAPAKPEWTDTTFETSTTTKCTTCKDVHFKTNGYDHEFTQKAEIECISLQNVLRLLIEFEQEKDTKNTECLRFLNRKGLLRE